MNLIHGFMLTGKKSGYCGVALFCKEKPISVTYGLNNNNFDDEGRIITAEFSEFFMINVCKYIYYIYIFVFLKINFLKLQNTIVL